MTQQWPLPQARHSKHGPRHRAPTPPHPGRRLAASAGAALSTAVILAATVTGTAVAPGTPRIDAAGPSWVDVPPRLDPGWGEPPPVPVVAAPAGSVWVPVRVVAEQATIPPAPAWASPVLPMVAPTRVRVEGDKPTRPAPPTPRTGRPEPRPTPPAEATPAPTSTPPEPSGCGPETTP